MYIIIWQELKQEILKRKKARACLYKKEEGNFLKERENRKQTDKDMFKMEK